MFRVTQEPSSGSHSQYLAKITAMVLLYLSILVYVVSVMAAQSKSGGLSSPDFDLFQKLKKLLCGKRFRSIEEVSNEVT
jgi:hypothetical protein